LLCDMYILFRQEVLEAMSAVVLLFNMFVPEHHDLPVVRPKC
jgi:hypothetical protein